MRESYKDVTSKAYIYKHIGIFFFFIQSLAQICSVRVNAIIIVYKPRNSVLLSLYTNPTRYEAVARKDNNEQGTKLFTSDFSASEESNTWSGTLKYFVKINASIRSADTKPDGHICAGVLSRPDCSSSSLLRDRIELNRTNTTIKCRWFNRFSLPRVHTPRLDRRLLLRAVHHDLLLYTVFVIELLSESAGPISTKCFVYVQLVWEQVTGCVLNPSVLRVPERLLKRVFFRDRHFSGEATPISRPYRSRAYLRGPFVPQLVT